MATWSRTAEGELGSTRSHKQAHIGAGFRSEPIHSIAATLANVPEQWKQYGISSSYPILVADVRQFDALAH